MASETKKPASLREVNAKLAELCNLLPIKYSHPQLTAAERTMCLNYVRSTLNPNVYQPPQARALLGLGWLIRHTKLGFPASLYAADELFGPADGNSLFANRQLKKY